MTALTSLAARNQRFDREVDARGLSCPLPILNTKKSVESLAIGEIVKVVATDGGAVRFFESLARQTGLQLLSWQHVDDEYIFYLRKP